MRIAADNEEREAESFATLMALKSRMPKEFWRNPFATLEWATEYTNVLKAACSTCTEMEQLALNTNPEDQPEVNRVTLVLVGSLVAAINTISSNLDSIKEHLDATSVASKKPYNGQYH